MTEPSSPVSEAMKRLGDAAVANVVAHTARCTAWATALGAAATTATPADSAPADTTPADTAPPSVTAGDALARSAVSAWLGCLRSLAEAASAVTDAVALLSHPPELVEYYAVDIADQLPGRRHPMTVSVRDVAWANEHTRGEHPVVAIIEAQPIGAPPQHGPDVITFRVRPSVAPSAMAVTVRADLISDPPVDPTVLTVRLAPAYLVAGP